MLNLLSSSPIRFQFIHSFFFSFPFFPFLFHTFIILNYLNSIPPIHFFIFIFYSFFLGREFQLPCSISRHFISLLVWYDFFLLGRQHSKTTHCRYFLSLHFFLFPFPFFYFLRLSLYLPFAVIWVLLDGMPTHKNDPLTAGIFFSIYLFIVSFSSISFFPFFVYRFFFAFIYLFFFTEYF